MASEKRLIDANALGRDSFHIQEYGYDGERCVVDWDDIEAAPTVDAVEVVHGRWEHSESMVHSAKCSKCKGWVIKHSINEPDFRYCPHCGAYMRGDEDE